MRHVSVYGMVIGKIKPDSNDHLHFQLQTKDGTFSVKADEKRTPRLKAGMYVHVGGPMCTYKHQCGCKSSHTHTLIDATDPRFFGVSLNPPDPDTHLVTILLSTLFSLKDNSLIYN